jgi:hypothetical protein
MTVPALLPEAATDTAVALACAAVRDYCGWHIAPSLTETVTTSGDGRRDLLLPTLHLTDVTAATNDSVAVTVTEWDEVGVVRYPDSPAWSTTLRGVTVTITHGYDACPEALAGAIKSMAARGVTSLGVSRSQVGQVSRQYANGGADGALGATAAELAIIRRYRIPSRT